MRSREVALAAVTLLAAAPVADATATVPETTELLRLQNELASAPPSGEPFRWATMEHPGPRRW
jgi:hypothetical protein